MTGELKELLERAAPVPAQLLDTEELLRRARRERFLAGAGMTGVAIAAAASAVLALGLLDRPAILLGEPTAQPTSPGAAEPYDGPVLFEVLAVSAGFPTDLGVEAATDSIELSRLWERHAFTGPPVEVDFVQHVVVVYSRIDDACPDEIVGFSVAGDRVTAHTQPPPGGCILPAVPTATAVAVDRATIPSPFVAVLVAEHPDDVQDELLVDPGPPPGAPASPASLPVPPAPERVLGRVPLPTEGAVGERLDDGTPVWVVRHQDGSVSVLAADAPLPDSRTDDVISGLRTRVVWLPGERRFSGPTPYDERGRSFHGRAATNLEWHALTIEGDRVLIGERLGPVPGGGAIAAVREDQGSVDSVPPDAGDEVEAVPLSEALAEPDEAVLVVDASLVAWPGSPLRICEAPDTPQLWDWDGCPDDAPVPAGVGSSDQPPDSMNVWFGPLRVRIRNGAIVEVVLLGGGQAGGLVDGTG